MFKKLSFLLFAAIVCAMFGFAITAGAEGDTVCEGRIIGTTQKDNVNAGQTFFNGHAGFGAEDNEAIDLSIVGKQSGLAPATRGYAACVSAESGTYKGEDYDYALKGFAWNNNLGFLSFNCKDGVNLAGEGAGVPCGNVNYGVYINDDNELFGHAWSPSFGWVQFKGSGEGEAFDYGAVMAADGTVSGHSWTEAGVYLQMAGMRIILPDADEDVDVVVGGASWCDGKSYVCVELLPDPSKLKFDGKNDDDIKVADGSDGYYLHLYLRNEDGDGSLGGVVNKTPDVQLSAGEATLVLFEELSYEVYLEQTTPSGGAILQVNGGPLIWMGPDEDEGLKYDLGNGHYLNYVAAAYCEGVEGAVCWYKFNISSAGAGNLNLDDFLDSIEINWDDTLKFKQTSKEQAGDSFDDIKTPWVSNDLGAVTYKPLSFDDFEAVAGDDGHYVSKEKIASYAPTSDANFSWTTGTNPPYLVSNTNFLNNPSLNEPEANKLILKSIAYGALEDDDGNTVLNAGAAYANGKVDLPVKFRPAVEVNPLYVNVAQDAFMAYRSIPENVKMGLKVAGNLPQDVVDNADIVVELDYDEDAGAQGECNADNAVCNFVFKFIEPDETKFEISGAELKAGAIDLQAIATLPEYDNAEDKEGLLPADFAKAPNLFTKITYSVDDRLVSYYSNKIPRVPGSAVLNPTVVVHGAIQTQLTGTVKAGSAVDTSGQVNMNLIRDTINENLQKYVGSGVLRRGTCKLRVLRGVNGANFDGSIGGCGSDFYRVFKIGDENVIYFKESNVVLALNGGKWTGDWVIISDGGNIFVDGDVYDDGRLSLVSLRGGGDKYFNTGHVYIAPDVRNIRATIVADGSVFSYNGSPEGVDGESGEPAWASPFERIQALKSQLLFEGAIYSNNTIGGADIDKGNNPKDYLLVGGGEVVKPDNIEDRMRAQSYDLNYLRMFSLDLEIGDSGNPIDQKCGKALGPDDIVAISNNQVVCGEKQPCAANSPFSAGTMANKCNGINPLLRYSPQNLGDAGTDGDMVVPKDIGVIAKGLDKEKDFDPVYVYFKAPSKDSFVFSKPGALNISGH